MTESQTFLAPHLVVGGARELIAPGGTRIELAPAQTPIVIPEVTQEFVLTRMNADWGVGRAGMQYRDLIPSRLGGRFIASHIRIPTGGPVPDYVHFHKIRFQMIFCKAGWTRLVYEDQGDEFILEAGDCVLQPPEIRHRVLEASAGLEVIEIGCPAVHETFADQAMELPTGRTIPDRDFGGQRFVRHIAKSATWTAWPTRLARWSSAASWSTSRRPASTRVTAPAWYRRPAWPRSTWPPSATTRGASRARSRSWA